MITVKDVLVKADGVALALTELGCKDVKVSHSVNQPEDRYVVWVSIDCLVNGRSQQVFTSTGYAKHVYQALDNFRLGVQFGAGLIPNKADLEETASSLLSELHFQMKGYCHLDDDGNEHPVEEQWRLKFRELGLDV